MHIANANCRSTTIRRFAGSTVATLALAVGMAACGSDKVSTPAKTVVTNPTSTDPTVTNGNTSQNNNTTVTTPTSCNPSGMSTLSPTSPAVQHSNGGTNLAMPSVLFTATNGGTNPNQAYQLLVDSYDYCQFSYDFGYNAYPLVPFAAASFYLIDTTPGNALTAGTYTVGATSGKYVYFGSGTSTDVGSAVTTGGTSTGSAKCSNLAYPKPVSGTITIDSPVPAFPTTTGSRNVGSVNGTLAVTLDDGSTISGAFGSGLCSGGANQNAPTSAGACGCTLN